MSTIETWVTRGDVRLAVQESGAARGTAPTLVLMHGWPDDHHLWDAVRAQLGDRWHVVTYDARGAGGSTHPRPVRAYRLDELVLDLFAVITATTVPGERVHLAAHDWGSVAAFDAICVPGAAARIATYTSFSGPQLDWLALWVRARLRRLRPWGPLRQGFASAYTAGFCVPGLAAPFLRVLAPRWDGFTQWFDTLSPQQRVPGGAASLTDMLAGLRIYRANIGPRLLRPRRDRRSAVPVQLVVAERDRAVRPDGFADYAHHLDELHRTSIPGGHWSPKWRPDAVAPLIESFAGQQEASGRPAHPIPRRSLSEAPSIAQETK